MFSKLKQRLDISLATRWLELPEISPEARVLLAPATEANKAFYNVMLKRAGRRARPTGKPTPETLRRLLDEGRQEDRELYPAYVIRGWEGIEDDAGQPVPFSEAACRELLDALPDFIFDKVREFAVVPRNFLGENEEPAPDAEELAGNSQSASGTS